MATPAFDQGGVSERRWTLVTHIQGGAAGRLPVVLRASSVLPNLGSLGHIQDVVVTATIVDDT